MDIGAWQAAAHGVTKSRIQLGHFTSLPLVSPIFSGISSLSHSIVLFLAWRIPGTGEPGGLSSMESHRVGHD